MISFNYINDEVLFENTHRHPADQIQELAAVCTEEKISRAEAVRRAIVAYLAEHRSPPKVDGFGLWRDHVTDGLEYQERIRAEWEPGRGLI